MARFEAQLKAEERERALAEKELKLRALAKAQEESELRTQATLDEINARILKLESLHLAIDTKARVDLQPSLDPATAAPAAEVNPPTPTPKPKRISFHRDTMTSSPDPPQPKLKSPLPAPFTTPPSSP